MSFPRSLPSLLLVMTSFVGACSSSDETSGEESAVQGDPTGTGSESMSPADPGASTATEPSPVAPVGGGGAPGQPGAQSGSAGAPAGGGGTLAQPGPAMEPSPTMTMDPAGAGGMPVTEPSAGGAGGAEEMPTEPAGGATAVGVEPVGDCDAAPSDASMEAQLALAAVNQVRLAAGAGCMVMISELNVAATNHCDYYAANDGDCTADAHSEVESCAGFTGTSFGQRAEAAGYDGRPAFEVMAFTNDPDRAVAMWLGSVWHQLPIVSPWVGEMGYGNADGCDTIDFGRGTPLPDDTVVVYPYGDQTMVPPSFSGREGPAPPEPPTGWPSGTPVTIWAQDADITEHTLTLEGDDAPIEHVWLTPDNASLLRNEAILYANDPLEPATRYRVRIVGTYVGGALNLDWVFETGEASRF